MSRLSMTSVGCGYAYFFGVFIIVFILFLPSTGNCPGNVGKLLRPLAGICLFVSQYAIIEPCIIPLKNLPLSFYHFVVTCIKGSAKARSRVRVLAQSNSSLGAKINSMIDWSSDHGVPGRISGAFATRALPMPCALKGLTDQVSGRRPVGDCGTCLDDYLRTPPYSHCQLMTIYTNSSTVRVKRQSGKCESFNVWRV